MDKDMVNKAMTTKGKSIPVDDPYKQIFVSRSAYLEKIRFYGFDMDFTLAIYKSPEYDKLLYKYIIERLIVLGYSERLREFTYKPNFAVRGVWFDTLYGNLLKVDSFGNILVGVHGYEYLQADDIRRFYPSKFIYLQADRVLVMNSLFDIAHSFVLATLVHFFDHDKSYEQTVNRTGVQSGDTVISYKSLSQDVANAVDYIHNDNECTLKAEVLKNIDKYIVKDPRITKLLQQLQSSGAKTFLLTNSAYAYTNGVMQYLIGDNWTSCFDVAIVEAKKPLWFAEGTVFRQIDRKTGTPKVGVHQGKLKKGEVYAGGNSGDFRRLFNARSKYVLYVGDHIFGDVLKSKKTLRWRTFLVVPELKKEMVDWVENYEKFCKMVHLCEEVDSNYADSDMIAKHDFPHDIHLKLRSIKELAQQIDKCYNKMGSLFRSGPHTTFFAYQMQRFADIYSSSCYNLVHYPKSYYFRVPMSLLPHETSINNCLAKKTILKPTQSGSSDSTEKNINKLLSQAFSKAKEPTQLNLVQEDAIENEKTSEKDYERSP